MHTHDFPSRLFATGLALLAGFVDALGFLALGGVFVSFMSGNSTRLSVGLVEPVPLVTAILPLAIIVLFVIGVMAGKLVRHYRPRNPATSILAFMSLLLLTGALVYQCGFLLMAVPFMVIAMGAANNVFVREGEVAIGVTYMTGTLVKLGQHLASLWLGQPRHHWLSHFFLWAALITGAILGAFSYHHFQLSSLWIAAAFCILLAFAAKTLDSKNNPVTGKPA